MNTSQLRALAILVIVILGGVFVYSISQFIAHHGQSQLSLQIAPSSAQVTIDGKTYPANATVYVTKSKHVVHASLQNFTDEEQTIDLSNRASGTVSIALNPANAAGEQYLSDHPEYQLEREAVGGTDQGAQVALAATPLINKLPVDNINGPYSIDYGQSTLQKNGSVIIISNSSPDGRKNAIKWIRQQGFDPTTLEINYSDFSNPLLGTGSSQ